MKLLASDEFLFDIGPAGKLRERVENSAAARVDKNSLLARMDRLWEQVAERESDYDEITEGLEMDLLPSQKIRVEEALDELKTTPGAYYREHGRNTPSRPGIEEAEDTLVNVQTALDEIQTALGEGEAEFPDVSWFADADDDLRVIAEAVAVITSYKDEVKEQLGELEAIRNKASLLDQETGSEQ